MVGGRGGGGNLTTKIPKFLPLLQKPSFFQVNLPDGRVQIVNYVSDENGYRADVTYEGEPQYPAPPPGGYGPYTGPGAYPGPKPGGYNRR